MLTTQSTHSNGCQVVHWPCQRHRVPVRKIFALRLFVVDICQDLLILCTMLVLILCHFHSTFSTGQGLILSFPSSRKQGNIRYYSSYLYLSLKLNLNAIIFCSLRRCQIAIHTIEMSTLDQIKTIFEMFKSGHSPHLHLG